MDEGDGRARGGSGQRAGDFQADLDRSLLEQQGRTGAPQSDAAYTRPRRGARPKASQSKLRRLLEKIRPFPYLDARASRRGIGGGRSAGSGGISLRDGSERSAAAQSEKYHRAGLRPGRGKTSLMRQTIHSAGLRR